MPEVARPARADEIRPFALPSLRALRPALAATMVALLAACGTLRQGPASGRDGPEARPPANLDQVPDAVPQIEPIRNGGPNKPYEVGGHTYTPITDDRPVTEKGLASWYGKKFHGRRTASGESYNMYAMTAAHKTLPIPSYARVRNPANGREIVVRVNDRGPFSPGRVIDLSYTAALRLGVLGGVAPIELERITAEDIRTGAALKRNPPAARNPASPAGDAGAAGSDSPGPELPADRATDPGQAAEAPDSPSSDATASATKAETDAPSPPAGVVLPPQPTSSAMPPAPAASYPDPREERGRAETDAGAGFWVQLGAYRERNGALDFQHRLVDEQPWLAPLLAVFNDHGLNKLQAGPYPSREDARQAALRIRVALQLVPTIVEKR